MIPPKTPKNEKERKAAVDSLHILDTKPEERFDRLTEAAVKKLKVPISTVSIIDKDREWYKSCQGVSTREGDRRVSFCGHALLAQSVFIVEDTFKDVRFRDNPLVTGLPFIRFYAGMVLSDRKTGLPVGVFCIKDIKPRKLNKDELAIFLELAEQAENELNR